MAGYASMVGLLSTLVHSSAIIGISASSPKRSNDVNDVDVGIDTGSPVGNYPHDYRFTGKIVGVTLERLSEVPEEIAARVREGMFVASLSTQ